MGSKRKEEKSLQDGAQGVYSRIGRIPEFGSTTWQKRLWLFNLLISARGAGRRLHCCLLSVSVCTPFILYLISSVPPGLCQVSAGTRKNLFFPIQCKTRLLGKMGVCFLLICQQ